MSFHELMTHITKSRHLRIALVKFTKANTSALEGLALILSELIIDGDRGIILVLSNRPASSVVDKLAKRITELPGAIKEGRIYLIDCLTKSVHGPLIPDVRNLLLISSPADLNELQLNMERALRGLGKRYREIWMIMDGLSTFLLFNGLSKVMRFLIFCINRLRSLNHYGAILYYGSELEKQIEGLLRQYVDAVCEI